MNGRDSVFRPTGRPLTLPTRPCRCIINAHKDYVNNTLVINVLHASAVGAGFIPVVPATDEIQSKYYLCVNGLRGAGIRSGTGYPFATLYILYPVAATMMLVSGARILKKQ